MTEPKNPEKVYTRIKRSDSQEVRVVRVNWKGNDLIHIREYYKPYEDADMKPGRGIAIKPEALQQVVNALMLALEDEANARRT